MIVTQKDYEREMRAGLNPDETFRPGIYRGRKTETKIGIYIKLDRDVLQFFKEQAKTPNAAPYQTQINNALRTFIERKREPQDFSELIDNETFIDAVAKRVRRKIPSGRTA